MSPRDIETEEDIRLLVDTFYGAALEDPLLGPIFRDVARLDLPAHLPTMYTFWSTLLLGTGTYSRNAFEVHLKLQEHLSREHFARWLELFHHTVDAHFEGFRAKTAKHRARNIALAMQGKMGLLAR